MFKFTYHSGDIWAEKDENGVTCFYLDPEQLKKWMYQNGADYTGDYIEGCLQDNFVLSTRRGFAAVYEHYLNCWSSDYYIEFQPGAAQDVFRGWYEFEEKAEAEIC